MSYFNNQQGGYYQQSQPGYPPGQPQQQQSYDPNYPQQQQQQQQQQTGGYSQPHNGGMAPMNAYPPNPNGFPPMYPNPSVPVYSAYPETQKTNHGVSTYQGFVSGLSGWNDPPKLDQTVDDPIIEKTPQPVNLIVSSITSALENIKASPVCFFRNGD